MRFLQSGMRSFPAVILAVLTAVSVLSGCGSAKSGESTGTLSGTDENTVSEWFYDSFDEIHKAAYDAFRDAASEPFDGTAVEIIDPNGNKTEIPVSELNTVYQGFLYDHPEVFWLSSSYNYRVSGQSGREEIADAISVIPIPETEEELEAQKKEFESAAQKMLDSASGADDDRERALKLYNCLTEGTEYEEEALYDSTLKKEHTAYGAVVCRKAVCDGVALAYKYLMDRCGIRCIVIPGKSEEMPHVWNTAYWDGSWHEADPSWDIVSGENNKGQYFDLTTEEMSKDHERELEGIAILIPAAE